MECTFVMLKPSATMRGLIGEIISCMEKRGLKIIAMKMTWVTVEKAHKLYSVHEGKPFLGNLVKHITSAPVVVFVLEGEKAVEIVRNLIGATDPSVAQPGTIRGKYALSIDKNIIHAADSYENAKKEMKVFFEDDEVFKYQRADSEWIY